MIFQNSWPFFAFSGLSHEAMYEEGDPGLAKENEPLLLTSLNIAYLILRVLRLR